MGTACVAIPSLIPSATTAIASGSDPQNRLRMSTSSSLGPLACVGTRGSSAIPQIGHAPGALALISGCIGQVHVVPALAVVSALFACALAVVSALFACALAAAQQLASFRASLPAAALARSRSRARASIASGSAWNFAKQPLPQKK
jgi:hypothetical protein